MNMLAFPVQIDPDIFVNEQRELDCYAQLLAGSWQEVGGVLEFAYAVGVVDQKEIADALDENEQGNSRALYRLAQYASLGIGEALNARLGGLGDEFRGGLSVGVVGDFEFESEGVVVCMESSMNVACTIPLLEMDPRVAGLCVQAVVLLENAFGVFLRRYWGLEELPWAVDERLTTFAAISPEQRRDAASFHAACVVESEEGFDCFYDGAESLEAAGELLAELTEYMAFAQKGRAFWRWFEGSETLTIPALRNAANVLAAQLGESDNGQWARWVMAVCDVLPQTEGMVIAKMLEAKEGTTDLGLLLRVDIGTPWDEMAMSDEQEIVLQSGERPVALFAIDEDERCATNIVHAIEGIADVIQLILLAPKGELADGHD